ncbi:hypothetical protein [Elizabethkingia meningoseptica]|uniref:hypothetical protein n=1 Tax=Elizabethkingia meningoseptica TaxID=238 RepID=UPI0023B0027C|nr:hypothetical protein [Elizabethkingia meningoseptica]
MREKLVEELITCYRRHLGVPLSIGGGKEFFQHSPVLVGNSHNGDPVGKLLLQGFHFGEIGQAAAAPGRPEVDEDEFISVF